MKIFASSLAFAAFLSVPALVFAQVPSTGPTASVIATVEAKRGKDIPPVTPQDIRVQVNRQTVPVTSFTSVGDAPMQLLLLIDDSARFSFGTEIRTIQSFIQALPPTTQIGIGYMRNGTSDMVQPFTSDHNAAAQKIRLALGSGGADVSPYDSISEAVKRWPATGEVQRRDIILVSSGIEGYGGGMAPENPYVNKTIRDAQTAGVVVYSIYNPSVGHWGHSMWRENVGQNLLSQLSDETGGEMYNYMFGAAVDFGPFLAQIETAMQHQYLLSFTPPPVKKAGPQELRVRVAEKDVEVAAPSQVYVR